ISIDVHPLTTDGTAASGTVTSGDPADYYLVHVDGGANLVLVLHDQSGLGACALYVRLGAIPTARDYEFLVTGDLKQVAASATPGGGTYYVMVRSTGASDTDPYTLTATTGPLVVTGVTPYKTGNQPPSPLPGAVSTAPILPTTITLTGAGFTN